MVSQLTYCILSKSVGLVGVSGYDYFAKDIACAHKIIILIGSFFARR